MAGRIAAGLAAAVLLAIGCSANRAESEASALEYFKRGNAAYQKDDYGHAVRMYRQASQLDPRSAVIQYNLGLACYQAQNYPDAVRAYSRALQLDPAMAEAHRNLALTEDRLYNLESAQAHYNAYQTMVRAQPVKSDSAASEGKGEPTGSADEKARLTDSKKASRPAPKQTAGAAKDGAPASISELRRYGGDGKPIDSAAKSGGEKKWWTQEPPPRSR